MQWLSSYTSGHSERRISADEIRLTAYRDEEVEGEVEHPVQTRPDRWTRFKRFLRLLAFGIAFLLAAALFARIEGWFGWGEEPRRAGGPLTGIPATATAGNAFYSSLASQYSLTPAAVSSLTMPSLPLPTSQSASSFIKSNWAVKHGGSRFIEFVQDPFRRREKDAVLRVEYPKESYSGSHGGGVANMGLSVFGEEKNRAMASYQLAFDEDFDFVEGGKLPGLFGGDSSSYCTGGEMSSRCFSLRLMWRLNGEGELYAYIPSYEGECEQDGAYCRGTDSSSISFHRGSFDFKPGVWASITEVAVINSSPSKANGVVAVYVGEQLAFEIEDVVLRINSSVHMAAFAFSTFFGGSTRRYASTRDTHSYFKDMRFWEGDAVASGDGKNVVATVPSDGSWWPW